jgi:hypothetical protein
MDVLSFETQTIKTSSSIAYPHWTVPSDVHYHASTLGPGLVLRQKIGGAERVMYASSALSTIERQYAIYEL